ncbi:MAG: hypothetical protein LUC23_04635, partial [Prevotellaceae bacterium]|nr:hypothetical protein [Prevotellaceae bacterium]
VVEPLLYFLGRCLVCRFHAVYSYLSAAKIGLFTVWKNLSALNLFNGQSLAYVRFVHIFAWFNRAIKQLD